MVVKTLREPCVAQLPTSYTAFTSLKEEHFSPVVSVAGFPTSITVKLEYH